MPELTNLTDRIAHLRERNGVPDPNHEQNAPAAPKPKPIKRSGERKFAADSFMIFVYGLLAIALLVQIALIVWLDIL